MLKINLFILCAIILSISAETSNLENNKNSDFLSLLGSGQNVYQSNELKQHLSNKKNVRDIQTSGPCKGQVPTKIPSAANLNDAAKSFYDVKTTLIPTHEKSSANIKNSHYYNKADLTQDSNEYDVKEGLGSGLSAIDITKAELGKSIEHNTDGTSKYNNPNAESSQDYNIYETYKPLENYLPGYSTKHNNEEANNYNDPNTDSSQDSFLYKVNRTPGNEKSLHELPKKNKGKVKYVNKFDTNNINPTDYSAQDTIQEYHSLLNKLSPLDLKKINQGQQVVPSYDGVIIYNNPNDDSVEDTNDYQQYQSLQSKLSPLDLTRATQGGPISYSKEGVDITQLRYGGNDYDDEVKGKLFSYGKQLYNLDTDLQTPTLLRDLSNSYTNNNVNTKSLDRPLSASLERALGDTNKNCDNETNNINTNTLNKQLLLNHVNSKLKNDLRNAFSSEGLTEEQEDSDERDAEQDESQNESYEEEHMENIDDGSSSEDCPKKKEYSSKSQWNVSGNRRMNKGVNSDEFQLDKLGDVANKEGFSKKGEVSLNKSSKKHIDIKNKKAQNLDNLSLLRNQLIDPAKGSGVISLAERRLLLSNAPHITCYACSTLSNPTCLHPDRRTTAKYCSKEHDACIKKVYEMGGESIIVRDCATSCNDAALGPLAPKYKNCEICHEELCNGVLNLHSSSLILLVSVIFIKHVL